MAEWRSGKSLLVRTLTASVLIPVTLLFLWLDRILILVFVLAIINLCLIEFLRFCHRKDIYPYPACLFIVANIVPIVVYFSSIPIYLLALSFIYIALLSLLRFDKKKFLEQVSITIFAIIYLSILPTSLIMLRRVGFKLCLFPMILTWIFDTGAYLIGAPIGRTKLALVISPKKSYEGIIGGLLVTFPATILLNHWFKTTFSIFDIIFLTIGIAILSTIGDLFESAFKREADLKDTSGIFPGHGGALDRIDSLLFTIPFFYLFLKLRGY